VTAATEKKIRASQTFDLATRTVNKEDSLVYDIAGITVTMKRVNKEADMWECAFDCLASTNKKDVLVKTKGYASEKAQSRKLAFDHVAISLGRQLIKLADMRDSEVAQKENEIEQLQSAVTSARSVADANSRAAMIIAGADQTPLTEEERKLVDPRLIEMSDAKIAQSA